MTIYSIIIILIPLYMNMSIYHISSLCLLHTAIINGFIVEGIGCIKGKYLGKKLLFDGHIDTVPVSDGDGWLYPPFEA